MVPTTSAGALEEVLPPCAPVAAPFISGHLPMPSIQAIILVECMELTYHVSQTLLPFSGHFLRPEYNLLGTE